MARRSKYDPKKRRELPEPRYRRPDDPFEELTRDVTAGQFVEPDKDSIEKGFGIRRSKRPFEAAKEEEEEERSQEPEYLKAKRTRRRAAKRT